MKPLLVGLAAFAAWAGTAMAETEINTGPWRFEADSALGALVFNAEIAEQDGVWSVTYINGDEQVSSEEVAVNGRNIVMRQPSYNAELALKASNPGTLSGVLRLTSSAGPVVVPVTGTHGPTHRYFENPEPAIADLNGRWAVTSLTPGDPDQPPNDGLGDLRVTEDGQVQGFWAFTNWDTRNLTGEISGDHVILSYFDGAFAGKWEGRIQEDGGLKGEWSSLVRTTPAAWSATRDDNVMLADASTLTYLKDGYDRFAFSFPDTAGNTVSIDDPLFQDKVVLVTIGGSWCPTCHDEAMFLQPWLEENRDRGVEAVGLYYEYSPDPAVANAAINRFVKRYGIDYPMLRAGIADKDAASETLPMINKVLVYPTMIVVDRKGTVRYIHTGFPGQGTGALHEAFKDDFNELMDELLAEKA